MKKEKPRNKISEIKHTLDTKDNKNTTITSGIQTINYMLISTKETNKKKIVEKLQTWFSTVNTLFSTILKVLISIFAFFLIYLAFSTTNRKQVIIEPYDVSNDIYNKGFSGKVIANKIYDTISAIVRAGKKSSYYQYSLNNSNLEIELDVPGTGLSINSISQIMRKLFNKEQLKLNGEVISQNGSIFFTSRLNNGFVITNKTNLDSINFVLADAAKNIILQTEPFNIALYKYRLQDLVECNDILDKIITNNSEDLDKAYNLKGVVLTTLGDSTKNQNILNEALKNFNKAININSNYASAYYNWGITLSIIGRNQEAIEKYKEAIKINTKHADAYNNWGDILEKEGNYIEAKKKYRQAIKINPNHSTAYFGLGSVFEKEGNIAEALKSFKKTIELDPSDDSALTHYKALLYKIKKPD